MTDFIELTHPGEQVKEILEELHLTVYRAAKLMGIPAPRLDRITKGKRSITPDSSIRLGLLFGQSPAFWHNIQADYDFRKARQEMGELPDISPIKTA
ncbi:MAG: HigA family addiction module antitoxin [bacterium]|nr:HigA family addiction module antitoxin [bacterium]